MTGQAVHPAIEAALDAIPTSLLARSGSVFYTGRAAFSGPSTLYILGLNPGGNPVAQMFETVAADITRFRDGPARWSAYADDSWAGARPGAGGMQPRVLHMLTALGLDPRSVPASNVVFARSSTEATLASEKTELLRICWPIHKAVITALGARVMLCLGGAAGRWVRNELAAHDGVGTYQEENGRRWSSSAHRAADGRLVLTLTHPGRANWCNPDSDPTRLVRRVLAQVDAG